MLLSDFLLLLERDEFEADADGIIQYQLTVNGEEVRRLPQSAVVKKFRDMEIQYISVRNGVPNGQPPILSVSVRNPATEF